MADETNFRTAELSWDGGQVLTGSNASGGPVVTFDGDGEAGPSPVVGLLLAAGACSGIDVVMILEKMKVTLTGLTISVRGERNADYPRRFNHLWLTFRLTGDGLTEVNAARAVQLSVEKYCSVLKTLDPEMPVETEIVIG